jgi:hypothetical protein
MCWERWLQAGLSPDLVLWSIEWGTCIHGLHEVDRKLLWNHKDIFKTVVNGSDDDILGLIGWCALFCRYYSFCKWICFCHQVKRQGNPYLGGFARSGWYCSLLRTHRDPSVKTLWSVPNRHTRRWKASRNPAVLSEAPRDRSQLRKMHLPKRFVHQ